VEKRFEMAGVVVSAETLFKRLMAETAAGCPSLPHRKRRSSARTRPAPQPPAAKPAQQDPGPDLPETEQEFARLVRRAFCSPHPEPGDEAIRHRIDELSSLHFRPARACTLKGLQCR
jgi:hypothetical protein